MTLPHTSEKRGRDSDHTQGNREKDPRFSTDQPHQKKMIVLHLNIYQSVIFTEISTSIYTSGRLKQALAILLIIRKDTAAKATRSKFDKRAHRLSLWHYRLSCRIISSFANANFLSQKQHAVRMIRESSRKRPRFQTIYARHEKLSIPWLEAIYINHPSCDDSQAFYIDVDSITASK